MTAIPQHQAEIAPDRSAWSRPSAGDAWPSIAIGVMWLAVLVDAVFGPDIVSTVAGDTTKVPSAVAIAPFAFLGTWIVARYGYGPRSQRPDEASGAPTQSH